LLHAKQLRNYINKITKKNWLPQANFSAQSVETPFDIKFLKANTAFFHHICQLWTSPALLHSCHFD
jgi:hypothetical protein